MTAILRIVERFTMTVEEPGDKWFLDYVLRDPAHAGKHLTAGWSAMEMLETMLYWGSNGGFMGDAERSIVSCREWFGGMGAQALMVEALFSPASHHVHEYSSDAVEHLLFGAIPETSVVSHRDAYDRSLYSTEDAADLQILDYGDLTIWQLRPGQQRRQLLEHVVSLAPKAILLTDIACRYLHLHRERYETVLGAGSCADYPTYLKALGEYIENEFGYTPLRGYWGRWSTVMALIPVGTRAPDDEWLFPIPESPVGLEVF